MINYNRKTSIEMVASLDRILMLHFRRREVSTASCVSVGRRGKMGYDLFTPQFSYCVHHIVKNNFRDF